MGRYSVRRIKRAKPAVQRTCRLHVSLDKISTRFASGPNRSSPARWWKAFRACIRFALFSYARKIKSVGESDWSGTERLAASLLVF